jgi:(1->4)-alpha-D-glucan 1-alpha-D-glucosylmutase
MPMSLPHDWRRAPASSYRLQLHRDFGFDAAERIVPYLSALGVAACYTSPILMARPGSQHGYDIVDHGHVNPELGGEEGLRRLADALGTRDIKLILDFVPNHMAADADANPFWRDILENGQCSIHVDVFDVDWVPLKSELRQKLLLPVLGDHYGAVLERGELQLEYADGAFSLAYFSRRFPINPRPGAAILRCQLDLLRAELAPNDEGLRELLSIITGLDHLPPFTSTAPEQTEERDREKEILKRRLATLMETAPGVRAHVARAIQHFNGTPGIAESFDDLHTLLELQPYRLAYWRVAGHEINYRRFFDINDLAAIRMELPAVFDLTHGLLKRLIDEDVVHGIRIDHPDGLYNPAEYFDRLSRLSPGKTPYIVAEKILNAGERLVSDWAIDGTTGYDFLNDVAGVFLDTTASTRIRRAYGRVSGRRERLADVVYRSKLTIMDSSLSSELNVLADSLDRLSESSRRTRDFTLNSLRGLLAATVAAFPIYRTYITADGASPSDRAAIDRALTDVQQRNPTMEMSSLRFLRDILLPTRQIDPVSLAFTMKLQQFTAPVQAKGLEDTAFYRHNKLISLNEVGGDPSRFGRTVTEFHQNNELRASEWPLGMLATSTHDTKLGEDARIRVHVLAELVEEWGDAVSRWQRFTAGSRRKVPGGWAPDGNDVYRFYQTLIACWPVEEGAAPPDVARLQRYMIKAIREAKLHTSWLNEDSAYEAAVEHFVERVLAGPTSIRFLRSFAPFANRVAGLAAIYSLGQLVLKIASPGVADIYQGSELWNLSLVDPDNRTPVDFAARAAMLSALAPWLDGLDASAIRPSRPLLSDDVAALARAWRDGRIKLYVTSAGLRFRRAHPDLFLSGRYVPLETAATEPGGIAFARQLDDRVVIAVAARLVARRGDGLAQPGRQIEWGDGRILLPAALEPRRFIDLFTGQSVTVDGDSLPLSRVLNVLPVALLVNA